MGCFMIVQSSTVVPTVIYPDTVETTVIYPDTVETTVIYPDTVETTVLLYTKPRWRVVVVPVWDRRTQSECVSHRHLVP